jgi:hypothetical protein
MTDLIEAMARRMCDVALAEGWINEPVCEDQMESFRSLATAARAPIPRSAVGPNSRSGVRLPTRHHQARSAVGRGAGF